mmetsp:Transcript_13820/g.36241  ORF Transcript_13820/g.36241 Transcript_13820/m.36241 type:complete len:100 (+) Transcript_13820:2-301(+)
MPLPSARARMVVLAGARHVRGRVGVPNRFSRRTAEPTFSMVPLSVSWAASGLPAIERPLGDKEADWVLYTQAEIGGPARSDAPRRLSTDFTRSSPTFDI